MTSTRERKKPKQRNRRTNRVFTEKRVGGKPGGANVAGGKIGEVPQGGGQDRAKAKLKKLTEK